MDKAKQTNKTAVIVRGVPVWQAVVGDGVQYLLGKLETVTRINDPPAGGCCRLLWAALCCLHSDTFSDYNNNCPDTGHMEPGLAQPRG